MAIGANRYALKTLLAWANDLEFGLQDNLYGLYRNQRDAQKSLRAIADDNQLCLSVLGLEKTSNGKPCFAHQLKKCRGACVGKESSDIHAIWLCVWRWNP